MIERLAYLVKHYVPFLFPIVERAANVITVVRFGKRIHYATSEAVIDGKIGNQNAKIRPLNQQDAEALLSFLMHQSDDYLKFFRPHKFDLRSIKNVLKMRSLLLYGLFIGDNLVAYALLRVTPTGTVYRGRLVDRKHCGQGIGKFVGNYLTWQCHLLGLRVRSTVSVNNFASRKSFGDATGVKVIASLPNNFEMLEFTTKTTKAPLLEVPEAD